MSSIALSSGKDFASAKKIGISYSRFEDVQVKLDENRRRIRTRHEYGHASTATHAIKEWRSGTEEIVL